MVFNIFSFQLNPKGPTHTLHTPLDLVKCRLQVDQAKYKNLVTGFKVTFKEDGARGLAKGWAPTAIGYSAQGLFKYGLYEYFKCLYTDLLGDEAAFVYRTSLYLAASASAEFFADIALSPMEAAKVKVDWKRTFKLMKKNFNEIFAHLHRSKQRLATPIIYVKLYQKCWKMKAWLLSTKVWYHYGCVKFRTQWWNSPALNVPLKYCTSRFWVFCRRRVLQRSLIKLSDFINFFSLSLFLLQACSSKTARWLLQRRTIGRYIYSWLHCWRILCYCIPSSRCCCIEIESSQRVIGLWSCQEAGILWNVEWFGSTYYYDWYAYKRDMIIPPWVLTLLLRFHLDVIFIHIYFIQK